MQGLIKLKRIIDRPSHFWKGVDNQTVGAYLRMLSSSKKKIKDLNFGVKRILGIGDETLQALNRTIDNEIEFGKFYFEYLKKQKAKDFDKWVFTKQKDRKDLDEWKKNKGDCWVRSNGRVLFRINIKDNITSTRVSLEIENDSSSLVFFEQQYSQPSEQYYTNLRKKESIDKKVEEMKKEAEELFEKYLSPKYFPEKRNFELVKNFLHIETETK